ncbi:GntR family transcriptional regulator [Buttiauxella sp. B2]|uniref:GntR family transcriptional regulator n=1 Tax=Buttiauxella sp. B2 TaxID=2587812 RepID=UPI00111E9142|nr:GntR family transcriptional regulator [Buttiauxella sp. B2]TNV19526.1 GntR family transcriptional regulator [Buttiauxella sp. B2]
MKPFDTPDLTKVPSTSEVIAQYLRRAILSEYFDENEPIRQDEVAKKFNVSKIPVREALKKLEAEGLVIFVRNRGAIVTRMSDDELAQLFEIRILLEVRLLELSVPAMKDRDFALIDEAYERYVSDTNIQNWSNLNWEFHAALYHAANRPLIVETVRMINQKLERYLRMQISLSDGKARADREHAEIIALCRKGEVEKVVAILKQHIYGVCQSLLDNLNQK